MASREEIEQQLLLLAQHRRNLAMLLHQKAQHGPGFTPLSTLNGIRHERAEIRDIKRSLRGWQQRIEDNPNDEPATWDWDEFETQTSEQFDWETAKQRYLDELKRLYGSMRILGMPAPVPLDGIFTDIYLLDKPSAWRHYNIDQLQRGANFDSSESRADENRHDGLDEVKRNARLYILGKPGAGKTTFLKYLVLCAANGRLDSIPIFVSLKDWADSNLQLMDFLVRQFTICSFPNAQPFIKYILTEGKALVLFDGLDEVAQEEQERGNTIQVIRDFANQYGKSRCALTCRIAASDYQFESFTYCELSDFSENQMRTFVGKWFGSDRTKYKAFITEFERPEHARLRDLARTPLLLTLLCINFDETMSFPVRRAEIYEEALDALLKKWDSSRSIRRDTIYKQLSLGHKRQLLTHVAVDTFEKNEILMRHAELERRIADYMHAMPRDDKEKTIDGEVVLKAIEAQHGLLVERARGVYSFSHLTFHEYFTARYIIEHPSERTFRNVTIKASDVRWREVLLLTASMLDVENAKLFFDSFIATINTSIQDAPQVVKMLEWAARKTDALKCPVLAARAFYIYSALRAQLVHRFGLASAYSNDLANIYANADDNDSVSIHANASDIALTLTHATNQEHDHGRILTNVERRVNDITHTLDRVHVRSFRAAAALAGLKHALTNDRAVEHICALAMHLSHTTDVKSITPEMQLDHKLQIFSALVQTQREIETVMSDIDFPLDIQTHWQEIVIDPTLQQPELLSLRSKLVTMKLPSQNISHSFIDELHQLLLYHRDISDHQRFADIEYGRLGKYFTYVELLLECLALATIVDRENIRNRLLLPPSVT